MFYDNYHDCDRISIIPIIPGKSTKPYSPYSPYIPYSPYSPISPYSPYSPISPYSPYTPYTPYTPYSPYNNGSSSYPDPDWHDMYKACINDCYYKYKDNDQAHNNCVFGCMKKFNLRR